jgi:hypothetical protein
LSQAVQISHEERHRALVDRLAGDLKPVRRLWPVGARLTLWLVLEAAVAAPVLSHTPNDFIRKLGTFDYALQVLLFAAAAVVVAVLALRSAIPGRQTRAAAVALAIVMVAAGTALVMMQPLRTGDSLGEFIRVGRPCAYYTCLFAAAPWVALWWAVKRGAPMGSGWAGLTVGCAALFFSFALMRLRCPIDERLHLVIWHLLPVAVMAALSTLAGVFWLRFRASVARRDAA